MVAENIKQLWHQAGLGKRFIEAENSELTNMLSKLHGYHLLCVGDPTLTFLLESSMISHRMLVNPQVPALTTISCIKAERDALPLLSDSVDVVVLPHTLEHINNPHEVLRETHRVLIPEGHVLITGFNPFSLWGFWSASQRLMGKMPHQGKMLTPNRVRDWLKLLNFQIVGGKMFYFRPPIESDYLYDKLNFLEKWGDSVCPFWGGAYTLLAVKRVVPLTPLRHKWQAEKPLWQGEGLPKPTTTAK